MATFRYIAIDTLGRRQQGVVEAAALDGARQQLALRGWRIESLQGEEEIVATAMLGSQEAIEVAVQLAELVDEQLPLPEGLRAIGDEMGSSRAGRALRQLSAATAQGRTLTDAMETIRPRLPEHLQALIEGGQRNGRLVDALQEFVEGERRSQELRYELRSTLAYPLLLLALVSVLSIAIGVFFVPMLDTLFTNLWISPPPDIAVLVWLVGTGVRWFGVLLVLVAVVLLLGGRRTRHALRRRIPFLGRLFSFEATRRFCSMLAMLLRQRVALPEALLLVSRGQRDASLSAAARRLSIQVAQGQSLSAALSVGEGGSLAALAPLVRWGEEHNSLPQTLQGIAAMYGGRAELQLSLVRTAVPPIVFLTIVIYASVLMCLVLQPLIVLLNGLT